MKSSSYFILIAGLMCATATAQNVLFDFDNAAAHTPLPTDVTSGPLTAHLSGTGQSFSIQQADVLGFTPTGFSGNCIYPDSVFAADLLVGFSQPLTDFSIMYAPEEYACDSSARMKVTAYMNGISIGSNTTTADPPGTWPTGTLTFSSRRGFNNVVIHYDAPPPTGGDWGPVFMADNMRVTLMLIGDANNDGKVDFGDLLILAQNYGKAGDVSAGDFNADRAVGFDDLLLLAQHYGQVAAAGPPVALAEVPEPASLATIALAITVVGPLVRLRTSRAPRCESPVVVPAHR